MSVRDAGTVVDSSKDRRALLYYGKRESKWTAQLKAEDKSYTVLFTGIIRRLPANSRGAAARMYDECCTWWYIHLYQIASFLHNDAILSTG